METRTAKPFLILIGLLLATSLTLAFTVEVEITNEAGVRVFLPDKVNDWVGAEVLFCQNPACRRPHLLPDLDGAEVCPVCGGELNRMSLAERNLLPEDTVGLKKRYINPSGNVLHASLVLSGKERGSIHRPEVCLVGQGRRVESKSLLTVPLENGKDLDVMVLELLDATRLPDGRPGPDLQTYYAYWFVGKDRETPYHLERILWMGLDRVFRNVSHRWAYIAVGGGRSPGSTAHHQVVSDFIRGFYPQMQFN